ncbi:MAG: HAMP domain-containing histidine kinase [Acidimicrobiia bacterium]|nr:HAMP domain-containing histidine kinase [Acidimicrobiia bacterium]
MPNPGWQGPSRQWGPPADGEAWRGTGRRFFRAVFGIFILGPIGLFVGVALFVTSRADVPPWVWVILAGIPLLAMVLIAIFGRTIWRTISGVRNLVNAAGDLADGDYGARADEANPMLRPVVDSFNTMAGRLESADEQRRRLLADLGHELRTPLTVIRGEIEAVLDGVHEPDPEHLDPLLDQVAVMERLLEDLRTLSLAEAGSLALHLEPVDPAVLVTDIGDGHRRAAAASGVTVAVEVAGAPPEVLLDPLRIREVLTNLIVNAIRSMPDGGTLTIGAGADGTDLVLTVADTGIGMDAEEVDRVFGRFHRSPESPGTGLGLTISKDLVEAHGGSLTLESEPGVGTAATARLPLG